MKEFTFTFYRYGYFMQGDKAGADFAGEEQVRLILEPTEYELQLSGEVLRKVSCEGYKIQISNKGAVRFCNYAGELLAEEAGADKEFKEFRVEWKEDALTVFFGHQETVDNYPNCDGESDRWSTRWVAEHKAVLQTGNK